MNNIVKLLLLIIVSWFGVFSNPVVAQNRLHTLDSNPSILLNASAVKELDALSYLELFQDRTGQLSFESVLNLADDAFVPANQFPHTASVSRNVYWLKAKLRKSERSEFGQSSRWLFILHTHHIDESEFYISQGPSHRFTKVKRYRGRYPTYPIHLTSDNTAQLLVKVVRDGGFNIPVRIWEEQSYLTNKRHSTLAWGLFFGAMLALCIYNLIVSISLRESGYFFLAFFLLASAILAAFHEGFLYKFHALHGLDRLFDVSAFFQCAAMFFATAFSRVYLSTKRHFPVLDSVLVLTMIFSGTLSSLVVANILSPLSVYVSMVVCSVSLIVPSFAASFQSTDRSSRFFLIGWSVYILGYVINQLAELGFVPINTLAIRVKEISLCVLGVSLSLGLAAQIQRERSAKTRDINLQQETMLELKYAEEQIQKKVLRDTLQGYPGFDALALIARRAMSNLTLESQSMSLVLMELLHLDKVEDRLGHAARNELVTRATKRLSIVLRSVNGVLPLTEFNGQYVPMAFEDGRYGFLLKAKDGIKVNEAVEEIEAAMHKPFFYQGISIKPGISFGVSMCSDGIMDYGSLFQHGSISLVADRKRNLSKIFDVESIDQYNPRNISLISQLRQALHEDNLTLYFQSTYDLATREVCGIEVLCRWESILEEDVSPTEIFYLAEVGGFVAELTLSVIEKALKHYMVAMSKGPFAKTLSINLSPKCIREGPFMDQVASIMDQYDIPDKVIFFEIKESAIIEDPSITRESLNHIRSLGIGLTIDDFGAAYSSPSYLSSLPVNEVKLNQRFASQLDEQADYEVVMGVINLCREQNIKLVVHGVEDESTLHKLQQMGCGFAQGHYLAEPVQARDYRLPKSETRKSRYSKVS